MLSIIAAMTRDLGIIGVDDFLPWYYKGDLRRFKRLTLGHTVIMGRKTFDGLEGPLPKRTNIIVSHNPQPDTDNVRWAESVDAAIALCSGTGFIIGGGEIYAQAINHPAVEFLDLTRVPQVMHVGMHYHYFPPIDPKRWRQVVVDGGHPYNALLTIDQYVRLR